MSTTLSATGLLRSHGKEKNLIRSVFASLNKSLNEVFVLFVLSVCTRRVLFVIGDENSQVKVEAE